MYHYIRVNPVASDGLGYSLSVTPADFTRQMDYLAAHGFHTVSMGDVFDSLESGRPLPQHPVVLTFDDGYADFATEAVPIMVNHGFVGTIYAVPGFLGHSGYMTVAQLQQVAAQHMVVGAHTVHHVDLPRLSQSAAWTEIAESRYQLQQLTGQAVGDFAYPYGHFNSLDVSLVQRAGFRDAVTTYPGSTQSLGARFTLPRVRVSGGESLEQFALSIGAPMPPVPGRPLPPTVTTPAERAAPLAASPDAQPAASAALTLASTSDELRTSWIRGSRMRTF